MIGRWLGLGVALAMALGGSAAAEGPAFAYDRTAPLQATYGSPREVAPGVTARSLSFTSDGRKVTGEVISGAASGPHPGVLFVHWLGLPSTTNHTEFEKDAIALARRGATSVLVDTMWADKDWFDRVGVSAEADVRQAEGQVADLRRALDVLDGQPGVDKGRIAYVGHDFGAMFGALVAGSDPRPGVYVLLAGVPTMSEWYLLGKTHPHKDDYVRSLDALDITGGLARSKARAMLFQFAAKDRYVTAERAAAFSGASPLPRGVFVYRTDHALDVPEAFADRQAWLKVQLFGN